ncbi:MAG TPA: DUF1249 domain-containing protein [Gammaproteobacteria bacterium]|nr:DUF1249 domain-containing protein [Gammaproteobacteria bacterium]
MELYELNYIQLRRLIPDIDLVPERAVSRVPQGLDLYLDVRERSRYTTTLHLSYCFAEAGGSVLAPDLVIRMYHDAQVAEVVSRGKGRDRGGRGLERFRHDYPVAARWRVNRFLHKWLGFCLRHGHEFSPARLRLGEVLDAQEAAPAASLES